MKRAVQMLIAASAVATVFGVGAVSYAKWTAGSESPSADVDGVTGSITTIGGITVTPTNPPKLYPMGEGGNDCWEFNVKIDGTGSVTVTLEGKFTSSGIYAKLYYSQDAERPTDDQHDISSAKVIEDPTKPVYVYMVAYGTNAMDAQISLTFTAKMQP